MDNLNLFVTIVIGLFAIAFMVVILVVVLNEFSPFKECENKTDNYTVQLGNTNITCGELNAINTTV